MGYRHQGHRSVVYRSSNPSSITPIERVGTDRRGATSCGKGRASRRSNGGGGSGGAVCDDVRGPQGEGWVREGSGSRFRALLDRGGGWYVTAVTPGNGDEPYAADHLVKQQALLSVWRGR